MGKSGTFPQQALASLNLCFLLLLLCLAACGGRGDGAASEQGSGASLPDLEAALEQEFQRLGIDPGKVAAAAPSGSENPVFDLALTLSDPDGEGPLPAESVTLTWTERFIGDYDQNGLVNVSDLTPLGINFLDTVDYDEPALHGGLEYWPQGDPDAGGAANWRRARVDGDGNGQVNISDITPIAQHWNERLSGYRLYLREPGDSGFEPVEFSLQPPPPPVSPEVQYFTVAHPSNPAANAPVRYSYTLPLPEAGVNQLYLVSYDLGSNMEGEPTGIVSIDSSTGTVNQSPVALLTVTPDFAGAPAEITLDATASFDLDGTISAYEWDFEGDGTTDWLSSDPLPEISSSGAVTNIASPESGKVTASYTQGSAEYYFPKVTVTDNLADTSTPATDQLGISGWEMTPLNPSMEETQIDAHPNLIAVHPVSGQKLLVAKLTMGEFGEQRDGVFLFRETAGGTWEREELPAPYLLENGSEESTFLRDIIWDEHNRPIILFEHTAVQKKKVWSAQQQANGSWMVEERFAGTLPGQVRFAGASSAGQYISGKFACRLGEQQTDKPSLSGGQWHNKSHMLFYDHGQWDIQYTGYDSAETHNSLGLHLGYEPSNLICFFDVTGSMTGGAWSAVWQDGQGFVDPTKHGTGSFTFEPPSTSPTKAMRATDGSIWTVWRNNNLGAPWRSALLNFKGTQTISYDFRDIASNPPYEFAGISDLYESSRGIGIFLGMSAGGGDNRSEHWRLEPGGWISEQMTTEFAFALSPGVNHFATNSVLEPVVLMHDLDFENISGFDSVYLIAERLDPRL